MVAARRGSIVVFVVAADPVHREGEAALVAALRHQVEPLIGADQRVEAAPVARIGVADIASPRSC